MTSAAVPPSLPEKLRALRAAMEAEGVQGYLVPRADEYQGEFVAPYAERLSWLTGFTGSAGIAVVLQDRAAVLSDARYTLQLRDQVEGQGFDTGDTATMPAGQWLSDHAPEGALIGYDPLLFTPAQITAMEEKGKKKSLVFKPLSDNLIDRVWEGRPERPKGAAALFPESVAGRSFQDKLAAVRAELRGRDVAGCVITMPDSIAWLLNIRGSDIARIPVCLSYLIVPAGEGEPCEWVVDPAKVPEEVRAALGDMVAVYAAEDLSARLRELAWKAQGRGRAVSLDFRTAPIFFKGELEHAGAVVQDLKDPCAAMRAIKTEAEQAAIRETHIRDGVAMVKFLHWLETRALAERATELDLAAKLRAFRGEDPAFRVPSFPSICGFGPNGAIVHYRATPVSALDLAEGNLLLIDSGGQYWGEGFSGTTDITRTVALGTPTGEMRRHFTLVLKGHIGVARARFPDGTIGAQVDALARQALWNEGLDFAHGTGHGVGCYLAVHEEAASISSRGREAFKPGMLISNEPGYYREGHYGIRIENLVLVLEDGASAATGKPMYRFETVSLAPIERNLIEVGLLTKEEIIWLDNYHRRVFDTLSPLLDEERRAWLKEKTRAV